jgi:hypothetical protein
MSYITTLAIMGLEGSLSRCASIFAVRAILIPFRYHPPCACLIAACSAAAAGGTSQETIT